MEEAYNTILAIRRERVCRIIRKSIGVVGEDVLSGAVSEIERSLGMLWGKKFIMKSRMRIFIILSGLGVCIVFACAVALYRQSMKMTARENVVLEFGELAPENIETYAEVGRAAKRKAVLDISDIDMGKVGTYTVTIKLGNHRESVKVAVKNTKKPEIKLVTDQIEIVEGQELKASDIILKITDKSGLRSVGFQDHVIEQETVVIDENGVPNSSISYDKEGEYENMVIAIDNNGMKESCRFSVKAKADYMSHITGLKDITVNQGGQPDWMSGIIYDERIKEVSVNADQVNLETPGVYEVVYMIIGDDDSVTEIRKKVVVEEKKVLSADEVKRSILQYYNGLSGIDGEYVINDLSDEFVETDILYKAVVRYQMSEREIENLVRTGRSIPGANILYATVTVSKDTWLAQDDLGNSWYLK